MNSPNGIILAADVFATPPGTPYEYNRITPAYVPFAAVHETIHFNQAYETGDQSTLLQQAPHNAPMISSACRHGRDSRPNSPRPCLQQSWCGKSGKKRKR